MTRSGTELTRAALQEFLKGGGTLVGEAVGVHGVSAGLLGALVRTPLSEAAAIGVGTGLALAGKAVVVELIDPAGLARAADVLTDLASLSARSAGTFRAPLVILAPHAAVAVPDGIAVGVAGVADDLPGLLRHALASGGPVVVFTTAAALADTGAGADVPALGVSVTRSSGPVTVLAAGDAVRSALACGEAAEVIDLRGPTADAAALASARRTGRVVIVGAPAAALATLNQNFLSLESPLVELGPTATPAEIATAIHFAATY
jgi:pyruvate/2-oxoglutarate/acetoin dehydrogenase E1 component